MSRHRCLKRLIATGLACSIAIVGLEAQSWPVGGRAAGMAHASLCNVDVYAAFNNPGALGYLGRSGAGVFYDNRFLLPELGTAGMSAAAATRRLGVFNLAFLRFGGRFFNRNRLSFSYARTFSPYLSAGMTFNYHYLAFGDMYGSAHAFTGELGVLARPTRDFSVAFHLVNPVRQTIAAFDNERLPALVRFGIGYLWAGKLRTHVDAEKDLDRPFAVRLGLEYLPVPILQVRAGGGTGPVTAAFGMGLRLGPWQLDLASSYHQVLGFSPQAGLSVDFGPQVQKEMRRNRSSSSASEP
ncbi:MAG: hypothetical protein NZM15_02690 [Flavobacteriales bacterium]|nr:hypothetical protein [Flavobacteriales bacterium]MDW8431594.1 hypothetical protein [Flavobacteriales bacterium]